MQCNSRLHVREEVVRVKVHFARDMQARLTSFKVGFLATRD